MATRLLWAAHEKVRILQEVDAIFINGLREWDLYDKVWQGLVHTARQAIEVGSA